MSNYGPVPVSVAFLGLQCPVCGEPIDILTTYDLEVLQVRANPCGHVLNVDVETGALSRP